MSTINDDDASLYASLLEDLPLSASDFYDQVNDDYLQWSSKLNIHFGYFHWRKFSHLFFLEKMLAAMTDEVLERLQITPNQQAVVLDAGCGVGTACQQMAQTLRRAHFVGVNISSNQIKVGEKVCQEHGLSDRIRFLQNDFTKISMATASCDAAFAIESACYDQGAAKTGFLREMSRVLKPGSYLVVADGFRKNAGPLPTLLNRWHQQNLEWWSMSELADIQLFTGEMERLGLETVEVKEISWQVAPSALHLPFTALKIYIKRAINWLRQLVGLPTVKLTQHQKNYPKAIWATLFLGLFRQYFGYYLVVAKKRN